MYRLSIPLTRSTALSFLLRETRNALLRAGAQNATRALLPWDHKETRARVRQLRQLEMPFRSPVARCRPSTYTLAYVYKDTRSYRLGRSAISPSLSLSAALFLAGGWIQFMILQTRTAGSFTGGVCVCVCLSAVQYNIIYYIITSYIIIFGLFFCRRLYNISRYLYRYTVVRSPVQISMRGLNDRNYYYLLYYVYLYIVVRLNRRVRLEFQVVPITPFLGPHLIYLDHS